MNIGLIKETKNGEKRVALTPKGVGELVREGHTIYVENNAGIGSDFPNEEYKKVGAQITSAEICYQQALVVRVKEPPIETLRPDQTLMCYLHIEKGQNPTLLHALLERNITAYAFEEIRDPKTGRRLVNLGFEAGIVGMFEGLRNYGKIISHQDQANPFSDILPIQKYTTKNDAYFALRSIDPREFTANVALVGYGNVSKGAQEVLAQLSHPPSILREEDTNRTQLLGKDFAYIWKKLPDIDILVNAIVWQPGQPRILVREDLERMKNLSLIVDISCDPGGGIQTCQATSWDKPTYEVPTKDNKKIVHFCVDNLPTAMAQESSSALSKMILPHIMKVASGEELETGLITKGREFIYNQRP